MKKKGLKLGLEGWAGRQKSRAFPPKGLVISTAVIHPGEQQPWVETSTLQELLELRQSEFLIIVFSRLRVMCSQ